MAPSRRKGASKAAAAAAARKQWKVGDLVLAKVKGFPAWPATVSEPEKWGYSSDWKKVMVYFFGTNQIAFCNPVDVEAFTEEKKELFLTKRHGRSADFVRAVQEIVDSYEKLKEQSRNDENSSGAPTKNPAAGCSEVPDSAVSNATLHSKLKSSNSVTVKGEQSCSAEDVEASMEVDILHNREECEGVNGDMLEHKNSCTARRSSRSAQSQCCTEQGKLSVRRSRSSFRLNSHKIQNNTIPSDHETKKFVAASNGILDSVGRRSKRNRKSPYKFVQSVGDSPVCNSNGTIDDNGSEVAMADSDTLSNNEVGAVESNHKTQLSEAVDDYERDVELNERLNLQIETVILRKKRKPARKRVIVDVVDCFAQPDMSESGYLSTENVASVCENSDEKNIKDGGDEHLPLVKRARVRMGKLLIEEEQLDLVNNSVENAVTAPVGVSSDSIDKAPVGVSSDSIDKAPLGVSSDSIDNGYCEDTLAAAKTSSDFLPPYSSTQVSHDRVKLWKAEKSNLLSCSFDGEAALPPSKRLHRAMEAMSANSAEEGQFCAEFRSASNMDSQVCHATSAERELSTTLERDEERELERENKSDGSPDDISGASTIPNLPKKITTPCQEASVGKNSVRGTIPKDDIQNDPFEEVAICSGFENHSGSDDSETVKPDIADVGQQEFSADQLSADDKQVGHDEPHANFAGDQTKHELTSGNVEAPEIRSEDNIPVACCRLGTPETSENAKPAIDEVKTCVAEQNLKPLSVENIQSSTSTDAIQETKVSEPIVACRASPVEQVDIPGPHPASRSSVPGSADRNIIQLNDYTPDTNLGYEKHASDKHKKLDLEVSCRAKASGKSNNLAEVKSSLSSLEMMLSTLTRAKESIGRATRIAIDCAKFGVVTEVVDIIARNLERESSLHRKVDLFFLVDSIAQCSRGIKGGIGDKYTSAIQSTLPRFLSAAAPPGYVGRENRRQCMKVLKLWLERKVLSESIICQQLRRLDSLSCSSSTDRPSQRMTRTERSFDDPIREMEGMHVDEYGSNSSFQLPGFCMPRMLKDEDGASDSDSGSFEAVTPEHEPSCPENHEANSLPLKEKHRHILEDVDGELEMEDVAPCEVETRPSTSTTGIDDVRSSYSHEQQFRSSFGPPVPHDVPSQAPPLPMSPPPPPPPPPLPLHPPPSDMPHLPSVSHSVADSHVHTVPETMHSQPAAVPLPQISENGGSCSFSTYPIVQPAARPGHNPRQADATSCSNGYFRPPHPPASNQFVYFNDQVRRQGEAPPPYCNRPQFGAAMEGARFYGDHDRAKSAPYGESWRFSRPPFPGPMHYEKGTSYQPSHYHGPSHEHVRTNHERPFPPLSMHHRNHTPNTHFAERSVPVAVRAPGYWPPR